MQGLKRWRIEGVEKVLNRWSTKGDRSKGAEVLEVKRCNVGMVDSLLCVCGLVDIGDGVFAGASGQACN